jgi:hypothetical protein
LEGGRSGDCPGTITQLNSKEFGGHRRLAMWRKRNMVLLAETGETFAVVQQS